MKILQNNGVPIYQQIADDFREQILSGNLENGAYLPSIRSLARDLKISVITTMKAYDVLEEEGLISAVQGKGFVVNARDTEMMREQNLRKVEESLLEAIRCAKLSGLDSKELVSTLQTLIKLDDSNF